MIELESTVGISGTYELVVLRKDGSVRKRMGPFKNLITDIGLNLYMLDRPLWGACLIGTGTTPPAVTDTTIQTLVARTTNITSDWNVPEGRAIKWQPPGRWTSGRVIFSFDIDQYIGTITEIGIEVWNDNSPPYDVMSRSLLPSPLTLIPGDQLQVTYTLYQNYQDDDWVKVVNINGTPTTVTGRMLYFNEISIGSYDGFLLQGYGWKGAFATNSPADAWETDVLLPATDPRPNPPSANVSQNRVYDTYVNNSFELIMGFRWRIQDGNFPTGIGRIIVQSTNTSGAYQYSFSPKIPKTNANMLTFRMKAKITRGTPPI